MMRPRHERQQSRQAQQTHRDHSGGDAGRHRLHAAAGLQIITD